MKLHKYRSCENKEWIKEILSEGVFYFAGWKQLNDPMEGYFRYHAAKHSPDELRQIVENKDSHGISCFSLTNDEILLWTHYASNHKGICIEIDADSDRSPKVSLEAVKYRSRIPWLEQLNGLHREAKDILSTKITKWKYEQEIRAFCVGKDQKHKVGIITRVILGVRAEDPLRTLVERCIGKSRVVEAVLDFETNRISA